MNLPWWVRAIIALAVIAILIGIGWMFRGWRADRDIAELRAQQATENASQAAAALADVSHAAVAMNGAAMDAAQAGWRLDQKIATLTMERRNYVQIHPLPADCKPDAERVRQLESAIDTANAAIRAAGQ